MSDSNLEIETLKKSIDVLSQTILEKIKNNDFDDINAPIMKRLELLNKMISLSSVVKNKKEYQRYIRELHDQNLEMIHLVNKQYREIGSTLLNMSHLEKYL